MVPHQTYQQMAHWLIADGMPVYDREGDQLGTIHNFNPQAGYLDIQKGWLFHKDFFVGTAAVASIDDDGLSLVLTKQDLEDTRFASPPGAGGVVYGDSFAGIEKEPLGVTNEEVPVTRASGMPVY